MNRSTKGAIVAALLAATGAGGAVASRASADRPHNVSSRADERDSDDDLPDVCERRGRADAKIATAKLIIEFNATDDDIGVHGAFDDHGWSELCVFDPSGRPLAVFDPRGRLDDLTMAGVFFESREPPEAEWSFDDLVAAFPEGRYRVKARNFEGKYLTGSARFTHAVPAAPEIVAPVIAEEPEAPGTPIATDDVVVAWEPVTQTINGAAVSISGYQVIVTKEEHEDPHGFSKPTYDVHVGPDATSLSVPADFFESGEVYELEVLALERSGNQTISVGFFVTA